MRKPDPRQSASLDALSFELEWSGEFYYIADFTEGGFPFGITWEELGVEPGDFAAAEQVCAEHARKAAAQLDACGVEPDGSDDELDSGAPDRHASAEVDELPF